MGSIQERIQERQFVWLGLLFGLLFPVVGTLIESARLGEVSWAGFVGVQVATPLLWIFDCAPLLLGLVGSALAQPQIPPGKVERQLYPLLAVALLLPLSLLLFALAKNSQTARTAADVNRSGYLRTQSLYIYALTQHGEPRPQWVQVLGEMEATQADLKTRYPAEVERTQFYWQRFQSELQASGHVTWKDADALREATDFQTRSIEKYAERDQRVLLLLVTLGLVSLLVGFIKAYELARQLQLARTGQQESEERFARLAESSFEGIALSQNGVIVMVNDQICTQFGYQPHELIGQPSELLTSPELRQRVLSHIAHQMEEAYESLGLRKDGSTFPIEVEGKTVHFRGAMARVTAVRDISQAKRIEAQLREANKRLEQLAVTDDLTGLFNRRFFNHQLQAEWEKATIQHKPFSVILLDIDRFKQLNDTWGHNYGDEVLKGVAVLLGYQLRATDVLARYGGEELAILLPATDSYGATLLAERCRIALEERVWPHDPITASFGVATLNFDTSPFPNPEALIRAADRALYAAKAAGRNRTLHANALEVTRDESAVPHNP